MVLPFGCSHSSPMAFSSVVSVNHPLDLIPLPSFFVILLIMVLLKTVLQQPWMQAVLRGVKPCMAGIILATGIYMVCSHCVSFGEHLELDMHSFLITLLLAFAMLGSGFLFRKKLSPIGLIALSAGLGIIVYGI